MSCFTTMSTVTGTGEFDLTKHVNYTAGMILGVDDFTQEFAYLSGRDRWLAREAIGYGTISGLGVITETDEDKGPRVKVEPGVAISPRGQLICVPAAQCAYLNQWLAAAKPDELDEHLPDTSPPTSPPTDSTLTLYVVLCYRDCPVDNVPIPGEPCRNEKDLTEASRIKDDFSLELRYEAPKQPEEDAVREFSEFLRSIQISDDEPSTPIEYFLEAIRDRFLTTTSPPMSSPPLALSISPEDVTEYMREAFRLWTTELRMPLSEREGGCAVEKGFGDCILLAELRIPLTFVSPSWIVSDDAEIELVQDDRPFLLHLRMLQEWMLNEPNDHGALTGLEDDDHEQYLHRSGVRPMLGSLKMGNNQIKNLRAGTASTDALNYGQVATGDLIWDTMLLTRALRIAKIQDHPVKAPSPAEDQVLISKGGQWIAQKPDHGYLDGLADDDHQQYLLVNGSRPMAGNLDAGNFKIVKLAPGTAATDAVNLSQIVGKNDSAGGDLSGPFSNLKVEKLQGKTLTAPAPAEGQILIFKGGKWINENLPPSGVTDHGALTGLGDDDHPQYLPLSGSRQMTGILKLGNNRITGIANGAAAGDAVTFAQAIKVNDVAGGDLGGNYPNPTINNLQGKPVKAETPNVDDALVWNGNAWVPKPAAASDLITMPVATITRLDNNTYEVWFNIDTPGNLALVGSLSATAVAVEGEDAGAPDFLEQIPVTVTNPSTRNVFILSLQKPEMQYMRFRFLLPGIKVKVGAATAVTLNVYAQQNSIKFTGGRGDFATVFVRIGRIQS